MYTLSRNDLTLSPLRVTLYHAYPMSLTIFYVFWLIVSVSSLPNKGCFLKPQALAHSIYVCIELKIYVVSSNMDGPRGCHTKWSKSDRERETSYDITYVQHKKRNDTNELIYKTETDSQT